ncbi:MAG: GntR family transcriptional regulator [Nitriliruptoraceae bacterium]|nr:GntR family transcriptional regulator [Nitriliruptoraceae bacterium]
MIELEPQTESSADRAIASIRRAIIDGTYPGESMLSENQLAAQLGMSRTPVRTALARLQDEGWIRIYPKSGALVRGLSAEDVADIVDARVVLETSGVTRATPQVRARLARELLPAIEEQRQVLASGDMRRFVELSVAFHGAFLTVGGNPYLIDLGERLADRQRQMLFAHQDAMRHRSDHIIEEHQHLLDCLRDDDPARFERILRAHLSDTLVHHTDLA